MTRILVVTAVEAELAAIARPFTVSPHPIARYEASSADTVAGRVTVIAGGVGMAAAAAATATGLALAPYDVVISMGIGGGFDGRAGVGEVVVASSSVACQLGADSPEGYLDFGELGLTETLLTTTGDVAAVAARLGAVAGPVLSVCTVTGTDSRALEYAQRWGPVAEAMEGFGVWTAARAAGVVPYEIRTISNRVGRRDRTSWDIAGALAALTRASRTLFEKPLQ